MNGGFEVQIFHAYRFWHWLNCFIAMLFCHRMDLGVSFAWVLIAAIAYQLKWFCLIPFWKKQVKKVKPQLIQKSKFHCWCPMC
jgi:hypothetical protein